MTRNGWRAWSNSPMPIADQAYDHGIDCLIAEPSIEIPS
jgi:hypothetical protein